MQHHALAHLLFDPCDRLVRSGAAISDEQPLPNWNKHLGEGNRSPLQPHKICTCGLHTSISFVCLIARMDVSSTCLVWQSFSAACLLYMRCGNVPSDECVCVFLFELKRCCLFPQDPKQCKKQGKKNDLEINQLAKHVGLILISFVICISC